MDIYMAGEKPGMEADIPFFLSQKTGLNPSVFHIYIVQKIPKNNSGKIQYSELNTLKTDMS